mmetsp:Transcript_8501/g.19027  ORF Transcript_8501/g.19027 Transcript_8501/m.19027 type:complete len:264 (-) Transcript_8501:972-1763(-)
MPMPLISTNILPGEIPTAYASESRDKECTYKPRGMREMVMPSFGCAALVALLEVAVFGKPGVPSTVYFAPFITCLPVPPGVSNGFESMTPPPPHALGEKLELDKKVPLSDSDEGDENMSGVDCVLDCIDGLLGVSCFALPEAFCAAFCCFSDGPASNTAPYVTQWGIPAAPIPCWGRMSTSLFSPWMGKKSLPNTASTHSLRTSFRNVVLLLFPVVILFAVLTFVTFVSLFVPRGWDEDSITSPIMAMVISVEDSGNSTVSPS